MRINGVQTRRLGSATDGGLQKVANAALQIYSLLQVLFNTVFEEFQSLHEVSLHDFLKPSEFFVLQGESP